MERIFRQDFFTQREQPLLGRVSLATSVPSTIITIALAAFVLASVALLLLGSYHRREHATGALVPSLGLTQIIPPVASVVTAVHVRQGDHVHAGDVLVEVASQQGSRTNGDTADQVAKELGRELDEIEHQLGVMPAQYAAQQSALDVALRLHRDQLVHFDAQLLLESDQLKHLQAILDKTQPLLEKGYVSVLQLQQQNSDVASTKLAIENLRSERISVDEEIADIQGKLAALNEERFSKEADLRTKRATVMQSVAQNDAARVGAIRSPISGVVASVLTNVGQSASPQSPLMSLIPDQSPLEAHALLTGRAAGLIHPGTLVNIRYDAFPYQRFGMFKGTVISVSANAIAPDQLLRIEGREVKEPMYIARIRLDQKDGRTASATPGELVTGATFEADFLLESHRLVEILWAPLAGLKSPRG